jgi:hypothetical protein
MSAIVALFLAGAIVAVPVMLQVLDPVGDATAMRMLRVVRRVSIPCLVSLAVAFAVGSPLSGVLALPWLVVALLGAAAAGLDVLAHARRNVGEVIRPSRRHASWAALVFLAVGAAHAAADRFGIQPFGFEPTIVLLTAVHFHIAGLVLLAAGIDAERVDPWMGTRLGLGSVIVGIPVTAVGFFGIPVAALLGALLVSFGGALIGVGVLLRASRRHSPPGRALARIAGLSVLAAMPFAAAYAIGQVAGTSWLDIPLMARTHGALNILGFAIPIAVATMLESGNGR